MSLCSWIVWLQTCCMTSDQNKNICGLIFVCFHSYLFLQSGMALAYDPTAMQNGYVDHFLLSFTNESFPKKNKKKPHPYFTFTILWLIFAEHKLCPIPTCLRVFTKPKPLAAANRQRPASHQHRYAQEHFHANVQEYLNRYRTCGLLKHTLSYPWVSFHSCLHYLFWLMQDVACINAPMHTACQTCTFWLHQKKFGNVTVSL